MIVGNECAYAAEKFPSLRRRSLPLQSRPRCQLQDRGVELFLWASTPRSLCSIQHYLISFEIFSFWFDFYNRLVPCSWRSQGFLETTLLVPSICSWSPGLGSFWERRLAFNLRPTCLEWSSRPILTIFAIWPRTVSRTLSACFLALPRTFSFLFFD